MLGWPQLGSDVRGQPEREHKLEVSLPVLENCECQICLYTMIYAMFAVCRAWRANNEAIYRDGLFRLEISTEVWTNRAAGTCSASNKADMEEETA